MIVVDVVLAGGQFQSCEWTWLQGMRVLTVFPNSPAEAAGLVPNKALCNLARRFALQQLTVFRISCSERRR